MAENALADVLGYGPSQIPSSNALAQRASILPIGIDVYGGAQWAVPGMIHDGWNAFWGAGDAAAAGDWQGAGRAGAQAAGMAMTGGMAMPRPANALASNGGRPTYLSEMHGARAAAYREQQKQEAIRLMRENAELFASHPEGFKILEQLERAAMRDSFGPSIKPPPVGGGSVLPFRR